MIDIKYSIDTAGYDVNSLGYRSVEFNQVDWANSYIIQGCSQVFGESTMDNNKIVSFYLSELLNAPVINLGVPGAGMDIQYINTLDILEQNIKPKGVFIVYPNLERYTLYSNDIPSHKGGWSEEEFLKWISDGNSRKHNLNLVRGYRLLWKLYNIPLYEWSHLPENSDICKTDFEWYRASYMSDRAPDGHHWGQKTIQGVAEKLFELTTAT